MKIATLNQFRIKGRYKVIERNGLLIANSKNKCKIKMIR